MSMPSSMVGARAVVLRLGIALLLMAVSAPGALAQSPSPLPSPAPSPAVQPTSGPVLPPPSEVPLPAAPQPKGRPDASTTRHGVRVELWLSSSTVTPGEWVQAVVRATNLLETPAFAMSGECGPSGHLRVGAPRPRGPTGPDLHGECGTFKRQVLRDSLLTHAGFDRRKDLLRWNTASASSGAAFGFVECPYPPPGPRRLGPGASVTERFAWYPVGSFAEDPWFHPMWPGAGTVTVSWPYLSRGAPPAVSARRMGRMVEPIRATAALEVTGEGPNASGLPELVDIALADPRFRAWVEADPSRRSWRGASASAESGPTFEPNLYLWNLPDPPSTGVVFVELERAIDRQSHRGVVTLDPWTGEVLQVECVGPSQFRPCPQPGPLAWSGDELASANPDGQEADLALPAGLGDSIASSSMPSPVAPRGTPSTSPLAADSLDWRQVIPSQGPRGWISEVTTWSKGFATLGEDARGGPTIWVSPDGSSWTSQALPFLKRLQPHLGALDDRLIIVAAVPHGEVERLASWVSRDGGAWRRAPDRPVMGLASRPGTWGHLAVSHPVVMDGQLVVHGHWDGCCGAVTPRIAGQPGRHAFVSASAARNGIVAWRTHDGLHWTRHPITRSLDSLDCVTEDGERLIGLDYGSPLVASTDGVRWQPVGEVPIDRGPPDAACVWSTATGYLQVGVAEDDAVPGFDSSTGISASADLRYWSPVQTLLGFEVGGVAVLGDTVVLDGSQSGPDLPEPVALQLLSTDGGRTWAPTSAWPSTTIASDGRVIVAVGDGAWTVRRTP